MNSMEKIAREAVHILIAEDSPTQAQQLKYILEQQGYNVTHTVNGRLALDAALRRKPTLIISDVLMPEMNGYELCRAVKSEPALCDTPIILVTTLSDPEDVIRGLECRADNFVLKPYNERHLLSLVQFVFVNREINQTEKTGMGLEIYFSGNKHFITANRLQILNLLLSTYDAAIQRNKELAMAKDDLHRANARLQTANEELESFAYTVSHDLRAPLRHIIGFSRFLTRSTTASLSERDRKYVAQIISSTEHMSRLIDELLDFSRLGSEDLTQIPVDLQSLLEDVFRQIQPEISTRNIVWKKAPLPQVMADPALLRLVLVNLLLNAVKYSRNRNPAEIEIGFSAESADENVIFVRDNGVGFDMEYVGKLFGVFQRLHRQEDFEGTGIGLATVRRIITRHGGRAWAEGKPDEGATFYFSLPKRA